MISVEKAKKDDLPHIIEIENASFSSPWSAEQLIEALSSTYVARSDGLIKGFICAGFAADEAHIHHMAVAPGARRQGIGRELIKKIVELPYNLFYLEVRESNDAAQKLYEGLGFEVISRRKKYYQDNDETALIMEYRKNV